MEQREDLRREYSMHIEEVLDILRDYGVNVDASDPESVEDLLTYPALTRGVEVARRVADAIATYLERKVKELTGAKQFHITVVSIGEGDIEYLATLTAKAGDQPLTVLVGMGEIMRRYKVANRLEEVEEFLREEPKTLAKTVEDILRTLSELSKSYKLLKRGETRDMHMATISVKVFDKEETVTAITPKTLKEEELEEQVKKAVEKGALDMRSVLEKVGAKIVPVKKHFRVYYP